MQTVSDIKKRLSEASAEEFAVLERSLLADTRKGVQNALAVARRRLAAEQEERKRVSQLYSYQQQITGGKLTVGLDEVGRGPLAGPLTVGAVVLRDDAPQIEGLNDSKQVSEAHRPALAEAVKERALAWAIVDIPPAEIDECGMTACLRKAFCQAIHEIEAQGVVPEVVLLDGNPLHLDPPRDRMLCTAMRAVPPFLRRRLSPRCPAMP